MKLYTEEQVKRAIYLAHCNTEEEVLAGLTPIELPSDSLCINCDDSKSTHNICMDCIIKIGKENIELPSDEEIEEEALKREYFELSFFNGAKMVINKIQGGNNEQQ